MKILSLCTGTGALDMALQSVFGGEVVAHVEYDKHASKVLACNFSGVPNLGDVKTADWSAYADDIDWVTGGYPCQPFSLAGSRKGADDARHLWPGIERCIRVVRPRYVLFENVASHLTLGFDTVLGSLSGVGYNVGWGVVRASDAGAPHRRARLFIVGRRTGVASDPYGLGDVRRWDRWSPGRTESTHRGAFAADADGHGLQGAEAATGPGAQRTSSNFWGQRPGRPGPQWGDYEPAIRRWEDLLGRPAPDPSELSTAGKPHLSAEFVEWMQGLPAGHVTAVPGLAWSHQIKILGNGVVPQQAELALRHLMGEHS